MRNPGIGEANMGALAGVVVGAIGGLFAIGVPRAILGKNIALLFSTPLLGVICWLVSGLLGWLIGGQVGPRVGERMRSERAEIIAGGLSGLLPVIGIGVWGWHMLRGH